MVNPETTVGAGGDHEHMTTPVIGLATLLLDLDDDEAFLDGLDRAVDVLLAVEPAAVEPLLGLTATRVDEILARVRAERDDAFRCPRCGELDAQCLDGLPCDRCNVSRETRVTSGVNVSRETVVTRVTDG